MESDKSLQFHNDELVITNAVFPSTTLKPSLYKPSKKRRKTKVHRKKLSRSRTKRLNGPRLKEMETVYHLFVIIYQIKDLE